MPSPSLSLESARRRLERHLREARRHAPLARRLKLDRERPWRVELQLVGGRAMRRLNARYRGKDYATDVLSFPAPAAFRGLGVLGELVLCTSVLRRQAREQGHSPQAELDVLLVHGLLHLLGWDHERGPREAAAMARWEQALLRPGSPGLILRTQGPARASRARWS